MVNKLIYQIANIGFDGIIATAFVFIMATISAIFYNHRGRWYAKNKRGRIHSPASFRFVYQWIRLTTIIISIGSFLTDYRGYVL